MTENSLSLSSSLRLEYRAFYCVFQSLSVYSCSRCLCPHFEPHLTSLFFDCSPPWFSRTTSFSSLLVPNLAQFLVTNLVSFLTHDQQPIHVHLRVLICVLNLSDPVLFLTSSFVTFIGQWIFRIFLKHLCWKLSNLSSSLLVMRQVSLPYKRTVRTFELNILVLVRILYWLLFQTLVNLLNDDLAFPTLAVISYSAPPVLLTIAPKYVKLSTSSTSFPSIDTGVWSLALYLMSFVFLMLVFIPIALLCLFRQTTFFKICVFVLDSKARSSAKSMSSNSCEIPPYPIVVIFYSLRHYPVHYY